MRAEDWSRTWRHGFRQHEVDGRFIKKKRAARGHPWIERDIVSFWFLQNRTISGCITTMEFPPSFLWIERNAYFIVLFYVLCVRKSRALVDIEPILTLYIQTLSQLFFCLWFMSERKRTIDSDGSWHHLAVKHFLTLKRKPEFYRTFLMVACSISFLFAGVNFRSSDAIRRLHSQYFFFQKRWLHDCISWPCYPITVSAGSRGNGRSFGSPNLEQKKMGFQNG